MAAVVVEIDWGTKVGNLAGNARSPKAILQQTAVILSSGARLAFVEGGRDPEGKWPKRAVPNIAGIFGDFAAGRPAPLDRRFSTGQTLVDTGRLRQSVIDPQDAEIDLSSNEVTLRSALPYAAKQQEGEDDSLIGVITAEFQEWMRTWIMRDIAGIRVGFGSEAANTAMESFEKNLGFLINPNMIGTEVTIDIPARPFLEITPQDIEDISEMLGIRITRDPEEVV